MTAASHPPYHPDDELVSAVLDGLADDRDRDRVRADPRLASKLAGMATARDALAEPVPVDDQVRERAITSALSAAISTESPILADASGSVTALHSHRSHHRIAVALAVAAVVVAAVLVPLAWRRADHGSLDAATAPSRFSEVGQAIGPEAPAAAAPSGTIPVLPRATVAPDSPAVIAASFLGDDLGSVADPAELSERVATRFQLRNDTHDEAADTSRHAGAGAVNERSTTSTTAVMDNGVAGAPAPAAGRYLPPEAQGPVVVRLQACDALVRAREPGLGVVVFTASVSFQGTDALSYVYDQTSSDGRLLVTVDRASCATLDRQAYVG